MAIGQELMDVPFAELVRNLAVAIAEGQLELDRSSIETLQFLIDPRNNVQILPEIAEIIEPVERKVKVNGAEGVKEVTISSAAIRPDPSAAKPVSMSLLQLGIQPTFYQFTEAQIEVKVSISIKRDETSQPGGQPKLSSALSGSRTIAYGAPVNFRTSNTYSYKAEGSSVFRATLRPVPPPPRLIPATVTINTLTNPPTITRNG